MSPKTQSLASLLTQSAEEEFTNRAAEVDNRPKFEGGKDFEKARFFTMKAGDREGRYQFGVYVLPFESKESTEEAPKFKYFHVTYSHYGIPPANDDDKGVRKCVEKTNPELEIECSYCAVMRAELEMRGKDKEKRKEVWRYKANGSAFVNCLPISYRNQPVDREKFPYSPHVLQLSEKIYDTLSQSLRDQGALSNPAINPLNPFNAKQLIITITRSGSRRMDIRYSWEWGLASHPIAETEEDVDTLLTEAYTIDKIFKGPSDDDLKNYRKDAQRFAAYLEARRDSPAEEEEGDVPAKPAPKKESKAAPVQDEDDDFAKAPAETEVKKGPVGPPKSRTVKEPNFSLG